MKKIAFIGAPGSGKSTLASDVYSSLKQRHMNVEIVPEWVRYDIQQNGPMQSIWEQYRTRLHQKEFEDAVPETAEMAICDSATLTPYFYACLYCKHANPRERLVLQDMYKYLLDDLYNKRYDMIFYLPRIEGTGFEDGTRFQTIDEINTLETHMRLAFTSLYQVGNIFSIDCGYENRLARVIQLLDTHVIPPKVELSIDDLYEEKLSALRQNIDQLNENADNLLRRLA